MLEFFEKITYNDGMSCQSFPCIRYRPREDVQLVDFREKKKMPEKRAMRPSAIFEKVYQAKPLSLVLFLTGPILMYSIVEMLNNNRPWIYFSYLQIGLNLAFYYSVYYVIYLIVGRLKLAAGISSTLFYLIGTANHYVYEFRGRTLFPADFVSLRTAINVAGSYDYSPDIIQIQTFIALCLYLSLLILAPRIHERAVPVPRVLVSLSASCLCFYLVFFGTGAMDALGLEPSLWSTRGNGLMLNMSLSLKCSIGNEPPGYSPEAVADIAAAYASDSVADRQLPNVVVIMNESFADLRVLGEFETNREVTPFLDSLVDEAITGFAYSSVFGGTTANAEYEFLTGNTTALLPEGSVPYQLYVNDHTSALPEQLKTLGYTTFGMHPYLESGWNRVPVYEDIGFSEAIFIDDFENRKYMRNYVTDRSNYENLTRVFARKTKADAPVFIFNVTMQNHSGYDVPFHTAAHLVGEMQDEYPTVDQYLTLMRESDMALEYLISYFEGVEEPTVVMLFGDHQPNVSNEFHEKMLGGPLDSLSVEDLQKRQMTPYFIWANFPIEAPENTSVSMNYLAPLLLETAGLPLTGYQKFLLELMEALPVVNSVGYVDAGGVNTAYRDELDPNCAELLNAYEMLEYCEVFEQDDRPENFYTLPVRNGNG